MGLAQSREVCLQPHILTLFLPAGLFEVLGWFILRSPVGLVWLSLVWVWFVRFIGKFLVDYRNILSF